MTRTERVKALCKDMGVTIVDSPLSEATSNPYPVSQGARAELNIPVTRLDEDEVFTAAMHELGHFATFSQHPLTEWDFEYREMFGPQDTTLDNEAAATQWAIDHAGEDIAPDLWWEWHAALYTYLNGFRYSHDTNAEPPALFRKVFNETARGMRGSKLTEAHEFADYPHESRQALHDSFDGCESSALI